MFKYKLRVLQRGALVLKGFTGASGLDLVVQGGFLDTG